MPSDGDRQFSEAFGDRLRSERKKAGLSQEELATGSGLHRTEVGLLERGGRIPRADTVVRLAATLGVSPGTLLDGLATWKPVNKAAGQFEFPKH
jgi:transcriptional regulator with XRE-family HTH domain